jgi:hypothetical protein
MADTTTVHNIPYPEEGDRPDVPVDMKALADKIDTELPQFFSGTSAPPSVGDTLPDGTVVAVIRGGDLYFQYEN